MLFTILSAFEFVLSTSLPMGSIGEYITSGVEAEMRLAGRHEYLYLSLSSYSNSSYYLGLFAGGLGCRFYRQWFSLGSSVSIVLYDRRYGVGSEYGFMPLFSIVFEPGWNVKNSRVFLSIKTKEVFNETFTPDIVDIGFGFEL